jgi:hypothetical protein
VIFVTALFCLLFPFSKLASFVNDATESKNIFRDNYTLPTLTSFSMSPLIRTIYLQIGLNCTPNTPSIQIGVKFNGNVSHLQHLWQMGPQNQLHSTIINNIPELPSLYPQIFLSLPEASPTVTTMAEASSLFFAPYWAIPYNNC